MRLYSFSYVFNAVNPNKASSQPSSPIGNVVQNIVAENLMDGIEKLNKYVKSQPQYYSHEIMSAGMPIGQVNVI